MRDVRRPVVEQRRRLAVPDDPEAGSPARARRPRGSSRGRGAGSASRRRAHGTARADASPGRKSASSAPTRATSTRSSGSPNARRKKARVRLRVRDDEVGRPEGRLVDGLDDARGGRPRAEPPPVADERVVERDERVEDDRPPACDPPRGPHVEVPRVPDDHDVGLAPRARARSRSARSTRESCPTPSDQLCRPRPRGGARRTSTPAPRRHEMTCVFRGEARSYVPK